METLSLSQKQIILGGLLGDSYYNQKRNFIRFLHSDKQREYLVWKMNQLPLQYVRGIYKRVYKEGYIGYSFEFVNKKDTFGELFSFLQKNLYSNEGRKKISLKYLNELDALGLSIWWMDDGCLSIHKGNRYGKLSTHCFNYEEHLLIQQYFKKKWNINVQIKQEKTYYFIRFNVEALKKLFTVIYKYVCQVPCLIYKIDLNYSNIGVIKNDEFYPIYNYINKQKSIYIDGTLTTAGYI